MKLIVSFIKKEIVLVISFVAALVSSILIRHGSNYVEFIDFKTLGILLALMLVVAGLRNLGVFEATAKFLIKKAGSLRSLIFVLVLLTFVFSMFITNDVALITFVPFTIEVLSIIRKREKMIFIIVLQTIAANLGSMLTPIGNPQNLYLYSLSGMGVFDFIKLMLPYTLVSFVAIAIGIFIGTKGKDQTSVKLATIVREEKITLDEAKSQAEQIGGKKVDTLNAQNVAFKKDEVTPPYAKHRILNFKFIIYVILFVVAIMCVVRVLPYWIMLIIVVGTMIFVDRKAFKKVDYSLLLTFVFLFIFVGNMGHFDAFANALGNIVSGNEAIVGVVASQVISNVPGAILLSNFTTNMAPLIVGVNIGGLGTIIASMASLISYKYYIREKDAKVGKYFAVFTVTNVIFLGVLLAMFFTLNIFL